jgi:putative ABC transport system permease protein
VAAATTSNLPMAYGAERQLSVDGHPLASGEPLPLVTLLDIGVGYFDTLGVPLARGRAFLEADGTPGHDSAIVNQRFVATHFPREDPIGQRIRLTAQVSPAAPTEWLTIVGIAPTIRQRNVQEPDPDSVVYVPHRTNTNLSPTTNIILRGRGNPAVLAPILRRAMTALDPDLPLANVRTMDDFLALLRWPSRVFGTMFAVFAGIALVLAAVGLYAVTAYSVTQRTQELGIRMALGAQPAHIRWLILRRGIAQIAIGLTLGLAGALGVGRLMQSSMLLFQTGAADPLTLVFIVGVLVTVAVVACLWPVRRAVRLDPSASLRSD